MTKTPHDDIQKPIETLKGISAQKAKKKEGFFIRGELYQNKVKNVVKLLSEDKRTKSLFLFNEWMRRIEYQKTPIWDKTIKPGKVIDDHDELYIKDFLSDNYTFEPSTITIHEGLFLLAAKFNRIHPVKEYLEALVWDGTPRLDTWLQSVTGAEDNIYTSLVGRKMIVSMVKRIYNPGCQFDNLIVLEGRQGIYKTTMLRILGGQWYAPFSIRAESKDAVDVMQGKWLLEMEELTTMRYGDIEHIKAFLSRTVDRVRLSYRRNAQDFPRQCIFVGTMNPIGDNQYFKDTSENRRFWPIECPGNIKIDWLKANRDQLFAEAMTVHEQENLFLDSSEALKISIEKQEQRKPSDVWLGLIDDYITGMNVVTPFDILNKCLQISRDKILHSNVCRVGVCMRQLGWIPKKMGGKQKKYYVRPNTDMNTINTEIMDIKEKWDDE